MKSELTNIFNNNDVYAYCPGCGNEEQISDMSITIDSQEARIKTSLAISTKSLQCTCERCGESMIIVDKRMLRILEIIEDKGYSIKDANCGGNLSGIRGNGIFKYEQTYIKFDKHAESSNSLLENYFSTGCYTDLYESESRAGYRFLHICKYKLELLHDCRSNFFVDQYVSDAVLDAWYNELLDFVTNHLPEYTTHIMVNPNDICINGCIGASEFDGDITFNTEPDLLTKIDSGDNIERIAKNLLDSRRTHKARHEAALRRSRNRRRRYNNNNQ